MVERHPGALLSASDRRLAAVIAAVRGNNNHPGGLEGRPIAPWPPKTPVARVSAPLPAWQEGDPRQLEPRFAVLPWDHLDGPRRSTWPAITADALAIGLTAARL